jgi:hypothetical protein
MRRCFGAIALACLATAPAGAQSAVSGTWSASGVPFAPWTFVFTEHDGAVTGSVTQARYDRGSQVIAPFATLPIDSGSVAAGTITFRCVVPPDMGNRIVTFRGTIYPDSIVLARTVAVLPQGSPGRRGVFGSLGAPTFTLRRGVAPADTDTAAKTTSSIAAETFARMMISKQDTAPANGVHELIDYQGMQVDIGAIHDAANRDAIVAALHRQIDIVDSSGLDAATLAFLKSVPVRLRVAAGGGGGNPGAYSSESRSIVLDGQVYPASHPILLHELMHAWHDQRVAGGMQNAEILKLYQQARDGGKFPTGSYMLANVREYFAMMASVYLYGSAARDPLTRDRIRQLQPDCYAWLERTFGRR